MTLEELANKIDQRFDNLDNKVDAINMTVALHGQSLTSNTEEHHEFDARLSKLEKWMWMTLGAGGAAGIGIAKLFM